MSESRLPDYLDHIQQAAADARSLVEGLAKTISWPTSALNRPSL